MKEHKYAVSDPDDTGRFTVYADGRYHIIDINKLVRARRWFCVPPIILASLLVGAAIIGAAYLVSRANRYQPILKYNGNSTGHSMYTFDTRTGEAVPMKVNRP